MHAVFLGSSDVDWIKQLRSAGGISITAAPEEYLNGDFEGETLWLLAWSNSVDAMMFACSEVEKLARAPSAVQRMDVDASQRAGMTDREIHDVAQVAGYFAYANRIALGLGVELGRGEGAVGQWPQTF